MRALGTAVVMVALFLSSSAQATAQEELEQEAPEQTPEEDAPEQSPQEDAARPFVAGSVDVGFLYLRPRFSFGYGKPFGSWLGVDLNPILSSIGLGAYGGARFALPHVNLRVGARYYSAFRRSFLVPSVSYTRVEIEDQAGDVSHYLSVEAELSFSLRAGPGIISAEAAATAVLLVPGNYYVFEETLRTVVAPPWVWRARVGYLFVFGPERRIRVGPVVEVVGVPGREYLSLRAGLTARMPLWDTIEVRATLVPPILSRDELGAHGGDSFLLGIRWRWATG